MSRLPLPFASQSSQQRKPLLSNLAKIQDQRAPIAPRPFQPRNPSGLSIPRKQLSGKEQVPIPNRQAMQISNETRSKIEVWKGRLKEFRVYLDGVSPAQMVVEPFLCDTITHFITANPLLEPNDNYQLGEQAMNYTAQFRRRFDAKIWHISKLIRILESIFIETRQKEGTTGSLAQIIENEKLFGLSTHGRQVALTPFNGPYLLVEDMTGQYKPIVAKEFPPNTSLPQLYLNHSSRTVFAPKSCSDTQEQLIEQLENSAASGMISMTTAPLQTQQRPLSTKARLFAPKEPAQARKNPSNKKRKGTETGESRSRKRQNVYGLAFYTRSGYCENCCEKYDEFEKHIRSEKHRKWASNENNFAALDVLIKKIGRTPIEGHFEDPLAERNITSEFCSELAGISDESAQSPQLEEDEENFEYQNENVMDAKEASSDKPNQEIIDMSSPRKLVEPHETETKKAVGVNILYQCFNATDDQDETWTPNEMDASKHKKHQPTPADIIGDEDEEEILNSDGSYCEEIEPSQDITKSQFIVSHENEQADAAEDVHIDNLLHNSDELSHEELDIKLSNLPAVHVDDSFVSLDIQMGAPTTAVPDTTLSADNANTSKNLKPFSATVISSASAVCLDGGEIRAPVQQKSNPSGDKSPTLAETDESPRPKKLFRRNTPVYSANLLVSDSQEISVPVKLPFVHQILTDHDSHGDTESKGDENLICPIGKIGYSSEYEPVVLPTGVSTTPRAIVENKSTRVDCAGDNWAAISSPRVHAALTHSGRRQCMKQNVLGASHLSSTIDSAQHTPTKSGKKLLGGRVQELGSKTSLEIQGQLSQPSSFTFSKSLSAIAQDNVEGFHTSFASLLGDLPEPESPAKSLAAPGLISSALNSTPKFRKSKRVAASPLGLSPSIRPSRHNVQISPSHAAQLKPNACILSSGQATPKLRKQCDEFTQFSTPSRFQAYTNQPSHDASSPCDQH